MEIRTLKATEIKAADYNPRKDLQPEDAEYKKLRRSIEEFGYVEPIIWNERTGNVVGGHQRLKVLLEKGAQEIECVVVSLDDKDEKILNVLLNKVKGRWDIGKLADLLQELDEAGAMEATGFVYEKQQKMRIGGVKLHPQYEAKTMKYLVEHNLNTRNALFWIVGAEPRKR